MKSLSKSIISKMISIFYFVGAAPKVDLQIPRCGVAFHVFWPSILASDQEDIWAPLTAGESYERLTWRILMNDPEQPVHATNTIGKSSDEHSIKLTPSAPR
jgi:hypothetical protein